MRLGHLWLRDFRSFTSMELEPAPGLTALVGPNGVGKTNLLEAIGYLATTTSFRGAPRESLVRTGAQQAVVRAELVTARPGGSATTLIEAELHPVGRDRILVNRQPVRRISDMVGSARVTVFSPDDLALVKGGPSHRRLLVDGLLASGSPRLAAVCSDLERVLRQRGTLLRQAGGRLSPEVVSTLEVWDAKLTQLGEILGLARAALVDELEPLVAKVYGQLAAADGPVKLSYQAPWRAEGLAAGLAASRQDDLRRAQTTVGPHRDDVALGISGLPARTHASQGEQRSLALSLRLAGHEWVSERSTGDVGGSTPMILLDDVFSELDADRSAALLTHLPVAQALLTTTAGLPEGAQPELVVSMSGGSVGRR